MSTVEITNRMPGTSPGIRTKVVVAYYLLSVVTGAFFFFFHGRLGSVVDVIAGAFYFVATGLLYTLSRRGSDQRKKADRV